MANVPQSDKATRPVRVTAETWESASHEAIDRRTSVIALLGIAWKQFIALPEERRERLVRSAEKSAE